MLNDFQSYSDELMNSQHNKFIFKETVENVFLVEKQKKKIWSNHIILSIRDTSLTVESLTALGPVSVKSYRTRKLKQIEN